MVAALMVLMNVTLLHGYPHWVLLRQRSHRNSTASWPRRPPQLRPAAESPDALAAAEEDEAEPDLAPGSPGKAAPLSRFAGPVPNRCTQGSQSSNWLNGW